VRLVRGVPRVPEGKTDKAGERHGDSAIAGLLADYRSRREVGVMPQINTCGPQAIATGLERYQGRVDYGTYA
jgi:phage FluMu gp28-like protein